jgi:hypothetical protein
MRNHRNRIDRITDALMHHQKFDGVNMEEFSSYVFADPPPTYPPRPGLERFILFLGLEVAWMDLSEAETEAEGRAHLAEFGISEFATMAEARDGLIAYAVNAGLRPAELRDLRMFLGAEEVKANGFHNSDHNGNGDQAGDP